MMAKDEPVARLEVPEGATIKQVRDAINNHDDMLMLNGLARQNNHPVSRGDTITVMPLLAGG